MFAARARSWSTLVGCETPVDRLETDPADARTPASGDEQLLAAQLAPAARRMQAGAPRYASDVLKVLTSVRSEPEAALVSARLSEAGIHAITQRGISGARRGRTRDACDYAGD